MGVKVLFGKNAIETSDAERASWEDLAHGQNNTFLIGVLESQCSQVLLDIRLSLESGNMGKAQEFNGYLKCLEDQIDFLTKGIEEGLSNKTS